MATLIYSCFQNDLEVKLTQIYCEQVFLQDGPGFESVCMCVCACVCVCVWCFGPMQLTLRGDI